VPKRKAETRRRRDLVAAENFDRVSRQNRQCTRDRRGMTKDRRLAQRLIGQRNMPVCSTFGVRLAADLSCGISAGGRREAGGRLRQDRQQKHPICRIFSTGATGLEPATSGVTGRSWWFRPDRGWAGIPCVSRAFQLWRCGDLRACAGASGALLRDRRGMDSLSSSQRTRPSSGQCRPGQRCRRVCRVGGLCRVVYERIEQTGQSASPSQ
jgi:hypothetical protein